MIALGGPVGAVARDGLSGWTQGFLDTTFPMGTLVVNVLGSFLFGPLHYSADRKSLMALLTSPGESSWM
jgi:CrcB protein